MEEISRGEEGRDYCHPTKTIKNYFWRSALGWRLKFVDAPCTIYLHCIFRRIAEIRESSSYRRYDSLGRGNRPITRLSSSSFKKGDEKGQEGGGEKRVTSSPLSSSAARSGKRQGEGENGGPSRGSSRAYLPGSWHKEAEILSS